MKIRLVSVLVKDQEQALAFYTNTLGFVRKIDIPMGEHRWLTVAARNEQDGPEIVLEPMSFVPAQTYQKALFDAGIPLLALQVDDLAAEYNRLSTAGVVFSLKPTQMGTVWLAVFDDTCGNNVQLYQVQ